MDISHEHAQDRKRTDSIGRSFLPALAITIALIYVLARFAPGAVSTRLNIFTTIFLGIFIEASPFLVAGSILSGLLEVFVGTLLVTAGTIQSPWSSNESFHRKHLL